MLFDITIPEIPIIITLEPQNSAYVYLGHRSENRPLFPSILSKIRIYSRQKSPENEKYPRTHDTRYPYLGGARLMIPLLHLQVGFLQFHIELA